jgi:hypothetical protein
MARILLPGFLFVAGLVTLACQSYTTTMVESPGRVDEKVAVATLRSVAAAQTAYSVSNSGAYGSFEQLVAAGHLDSRFSSDQPKLGGYILTMTVASASGGAGSSYHCLSSASPQLRVNATEPATVNDEAFQP